MVELVGGGVEVVELVGGGVEVAELSVEVELRW